MANDRMRAWLTRPGGLATELVAARGALSMRQLADRLGDGWASARISKLEHGQQLPTAADLDDIAAAVEADAETRARWRGLLEEAASKRATFARRRPTTTTGPENLARTLEAEATYMKATGPYEIPALLQTSGYAVQIKIASGVAAEDADRFVKDLAVRQRVLSDLNRAFLFIIPESALRTIPEDSAVMAGQFDRLVSASTMSNVQVAVLPQMQPVGALPLSGAVTVYDSDAVVDDGIQLRHYGAADAEAIADRMESLWKVALKGDDARRRILAIAAELNN